MEVLRADAMGMCFGVKDAIDIANNVVHPQSVTIHGELVHNESVLVQLDARGFTRTAERDRAALPATTDVLITAHGISDRERLRLESAGKRLIDTTCPLVTRAHRAAQALEREGRLVIVIGRAGHVEVNGIVEDLTQFEIVESSAAVRRYPCGRLGVICQTTTPPRLADEILAELRRLNPAADIRFVDTICQPTRDRQLAVERLLPLVDAMVVVGGARSNNTRQLVALCEAAGKVAYQVESPDDLKAAWFEGCLTVGLTAGTSTPDAEITAVSEALCRLPEGAIA